ncbi:MAG: hypothetical protein KF800_03665 [Lysobacter sp.]|nr:hypothetical protein [Lysobacter sp.]
MMLEIAAVLIFALGAAHSYLGERYLLMRLFRRDSLPTLFGGTDFTRQTLRFAWHLTTVAWWGLAFLLLQAAQGGLTIAGVVRVIGWTAIVSGLFPLAFTRGRHLSWIVMFAIGGLALMWAGP